MTHLTRRGLLKTGLAASAGLINADAAFHLAGAETTTTNETKTADSSESALEQASPRQRLLLDYGWLFHLGNADNFAKDFSYGAPAVEGTFAKAGQIVGHNYGKDGKIVQLPRDDSGWTAVDLPHDWALDLPYLDAEGRYISEHAAHGGKALGREFPETSIGWYRRRFDIPASDKGLRISLEFDGVLRDSTVVLNGFYLGRNFSGYAPFSFDVTDYIDYGGTNLIEVRVDASLSESWYYEGAGIYRHTWLTLTHPLHVAQWGTTVTSEVRGKGALVSISTEIVNEGDEAARGRLVSRIMDSNGKVVATVPAKAFEVAAWGELTLETQVPVADAALWSIEQPNLYRVSTQLESSGKVTDQTDTTFGVRSIRFDPDQGFFLNGKPVKLKGTCSHQDHAGVGIAVPDRIHYDRVAALKQMGSNGWRTAHNPVAPEVLDACDRLGVVVMSETRIMASTPEGLSELERMIRRDRNHPSIILWSLANEEHYQGTSTGAMIVSSMKRLCKKLDPTRPVTAAMNGGWGKGLSAVVDVQGFNYWNDGSPGGGGTPKNIDGFHQQFPKLPTVGTEVSTGHGTRGIYEDDPKRGYVAAYPANCADCKMAAEVWWTAYDERAFLSGGFTWAGFDYRGEPKPYDHVSVGSQSGILDACGFPKDVYYYYKAWWGSEPVLHLFPHWNWEDRQGKQIEVRCYSNLDSVELLVNGKSVGAKTIARNSHLTWTVTYEPGVIEARGFKGGKLVLTDRRETTGAPAKLVLRASQSAILADGEDVSAIAVEVQDSKNRVMPTASNKVRFKLSGPGKIIGVGNGDPSCHEPDRPDTPSSATRSAFNGLCIVIVQAAKQAGAIGLDVSADGLEGAQVTIQTKAVKLRPAVS
jgi:beta-galactosidase